MQEFKLNDNEFIPLCLLLKITGLCTTGGHAKIVIMESKVKVDGHVELRKRCKIKANQIVEFNGEKIKVVP